MKNKLLSKILNIIFFSNLFLINNILAIENIYSSPFQIFNNTSLMSFQKGLPLGLFFKLLSSDTINKSTIDCSAAFSYSFDRKAISTGFYRDHTGYKLYNTGFSQKLNFSSFGVAFKIENLEKKIFPNIDISYSLNINKTFLLSTNFKNILYEYSSKKTFPEVSFLLRGDINKLNFELSYKGIFYDYSKLKPYNGLNLGVSIELLENKNLFYSIENYTYQNSFGDINTELNMFMGIKFRTKNNINGLLTGYQHNIKSHKGCYVNNLLINPTFYKYYNSPVCSLSYSCDSNVVNNLFFNINCFGNEKLIKKWSLIITKNCNKNKIIKSFSGGNIPPKIIIWDFKDSFGTVHNKDTLVAQCIISDINNKIFLSPIIYIYLCNKKYN